MSFLCGAPLEDLDLPDGLTVVFVKGVYCTDPTKNFLTLLSMKLLVTIVVETKKSL